MTEYTTGDILQPGSEVEALVNPVSCVGVMGRGFALEPLVDVRAILFEPSETRHAPEVFQGKPRAEKIPA